jgi:hypothetical protein
MEDAPAPAALVTETVPDLKVDAAEVNAPADGAAKVDGYPNAVDGESTPMAVDAAPESKLFSLAM